MPEISYRRFDTWTGFQNRLVSRRHILELTMAEHLDRYELRILALLQEDASRPTTEIAEIVGLSRSEEHTSELQSLMRNSYAVFCLKKKGADITNRQPKINKTLRR